MFIASKLLAILTQPLSWVIVLLVFSLLVQKKPVLSFRLICTALSMLLLIGWQPLPDMLMNRLERQYPEMSPQDDLSRYVGIVVLGGAAEHGYVAQAHAQPLLNDAAERMTSALILLRHNPHLRVVFTGGEGSLFGRGPSEAQRAKVFFDSVGIPVERVAYEALSRTTQENAVLTAQLPGIDITQRWLLLTSAWHMPRAMATFSKVGWNVTAYPVDFRTGNDTPWTEYSLNDGVRNWQLALHEVLGSLAYWLVARL